MTFWLLGSLAATNAGRPACRCSARSRSAPLVLVALRWRMNVMSLPEEEARALGVPTGPLRIAIVAAATLVTSASVATAGIIGWVGLVVPHLARSLVGPDFPRLLPDRGAARRRLSAVHRHARAHRGADRDPARHPHRGDRHAVLHLAARQHADGRWSVMTLAGRDLTIGYQRPRGRARPRRRARSRARCWRCSARTAAARPRCSRRCSACSRRKAGEVAIGGRSLARYLDPRARAPASPMCRRCMSPTFAFTVETVVLMGRTAHGNLFSRPSRARPRGGARACSSASASRISRERPYTMISGGERQLVLLARALAQEPQFVVLDEPTASLDFGNQGKVMREIRALAAVRPRRAVHHPRSQPRAARRRPRLPAARRRARRRRRGRRACSRRDQLEELYRAPVEQLTDTATGAQRVPAGIDRRFRGRARLHTLPLQ